MKTTDEIILNQLINQLRSAYRKCKTTIYYDSYSSIQRLELANFERSPQIFDNEYEIEAFFIELAKIIMDEKNFNKLVDECISTMYNVKSRNDPGHFLHSFSKNVMILWYIAQKRFV